jgi:zinc transport system ATP-binding protein
MLISCQNVSLGYEGQAVIRDLDFAVESGDYLWVVGENGSGKTTLIRGILRLLNPMKGSMVFHDGLAGGRIGYLPQQTELKKDFPAGVFEIVLSGNLNGMGLRPFYNAREKKLAEDALERLGIAALKGECYRELSGGQQRRALLARALCSAGAEANAANGGAAKNARGLLVLDEPVASLDPPATAEVYELLKTLNKDTGITIIMVSHDIRAAEMFARNILHLEEGRGFFGGAAEYLQSERGRKYFGHGKEAGK